MKSDRKTFWVVLATVVVVAVIGALVWFFNRPTSEENTINEADVVHEVSDETGGLPEKVIGDLDKAKVVMFEYADYGCSHCAERNRKINKLVEKYNGELAVVFRGYDIGFPNGLLAALSATAAQMQGYWSEYKDLLFNGQSEWLYADKEGAREIFVEYFKQASGGEGDVEKFREDIESNVAKTRKDFEQKMGKKVNLRGTPMFRIDGEFVPQDEIEEVIEKKIIGA